MKLANAHKLRLIQPQGQHALALRAIGQDLANLSPTDLSIEKKLGIYVVQGHCTRARRERLTQQVEKPPPKRHFLGYVLFGKSAHSDQNSADTDIVEFKRSYSREAITLLDQAGIKRRSGMKRILDAHSLAEMLRTIGRLVDANDCSLIWLKKNPDGITVEYCDPAGQSHEEQLTNREVVKLHENYLKKRGVLKTVDTWFGFDRDR